MAKQPAATKHRAPSGQFKRPPADQKPTTPEQQLADCQAKPAKKSK